MDNENEALPTVHTLADVATDDDKLFHDGYVKGISKFIKECATPMTIAIQGDWGTGKTSLINLIDAELREKAEPQAKAESGPQEETEPQEEAESAEDHDSNAGEYCKDIIGVATVDVWQQTIANPQVSLLEVLMREIVSKLSETDLDEMKKISEFVSAASKIVGEMIEEESKSEEDSSFGSILGSLFESEDESKTESDDGPLNVGDIESFKASLVELLQQTVREDGKSEDSRFVIFVDGLDHIDPLVAVDFMEQIKNYLDCPRCVFVLAVDEKTVFDGARKKFGDKVDERRKKMLFEKLVQVPLRIPISAYNLEKYIKDLLKDEKELSGEFAEVIGTLLSDPTPQSIKRYINTMYLYESIFGGMESTDDSSLAMLLAAVILEVESSQGFDAVVECAQGDEERFAENLMTALDRLSLKDGVNRAMLPTLWRDGEDANVDTAKRNDFLTWIRMLK